MKKHIISPKTLARFQRAAIKYDGKIVHAQWEPLRTHKAFTGKIGGWRVKVKFGEYTIYATGYSIVDVISDIEDHGRAERQGRKWVVWSS
jgi:hypothetical protein